MISIARFLILGLLACMPFAASANSIATTRSTTGNSYLSGGEVKISEPVSADLYAAGGNVVVAPRDRCPEHLKMPGDFRFDLIMSDAAIRQELGYAEAIPGGEALRRTIEWQRSVCPLSADAAGFDYAAEDAFLKSNGITP